MRLLMMAMLLAMLPACQGEHPFLLLQVCLNDDKNVEQFVDLMKSVSDEEQMTYVDRSADSQEELSDLDAGPGYPLINISGSGKDGVGWGATNFGLSAHEVSIGFSDGSDPARARQFAETVMEALGKRWPVHTVPAGQGAKAVCNE